MRECHVDSCAHVAHGCLVTTLLLERCGVIVTRCQYYVTSAMLHDTGACIYGSSVVRGCAWDQAAL